MRHIPESTQGIDPVITVSADMSLKELHLALKPLGTPEGQALQVRGEETAMRVTIDCSPEGVALMMTETARYLIDCSGGFPLEQTRNTQSPDQAPSVARGILDRRGTAQGATISKTDAGGLLHRRRAAQLADARQSHVTKKQLHE